MATVKKKNKALRLIVPLIVFGVAILFVLGTFFGPGGRTAPSPQAQEESAEPSVRPLAPTENDAVTSDPYLPAEVAPPPAQEDHPSAPDAAPFDPPADPSGEPALGRAYRVRPLFTGGDFTPLGSSDPQSPYRLELEVSRHGAGIREIVLNDFWQTYRRIDRYALVTEQTIEATGMQYGLTPMAASYARVDDVLVPLYSRPDPDRRGRFLTDIWREIEPGVLEALIVDEDDREVLRLLRHYSVDSDTNEIGLSQTIENLANRHLEVALFQYGPGDLTLGTGTYGGDLRRIRFGYLEDTGADPTQSNVLAKEFLIDRRDVLSGRQRTDRLWPNRRSQAEGYSLSYVAMTNRYFALAVYKPVSTQPHQPRGFPLVESVYPQVLGDKSPPNAVALELHLKPQHLAPGASETLEMTIYAGPLDPKILKEPGSNYERAGLGELIVYRFACGMCTFQWLAHLLVAFLGLLHDYLLFDWALAIIALVAVVRLLLHPLTKKAQINMTMFGKQMQALKPKMDKLKEKYADDTKKQQVEIQKLMREQGVNPANMLGCLPLFLQMPIWIALYAMLFYAIELRQQSAFFGLFQQFGGWAFMADLSLPDRFIQFSWFINIPLMGEISSFNILPLLMGAIFYVQQKYMTPTSTTAMTKEMETQQKIMKVMLVVLFPIFLYNAPSGLTLYILTSSTVSIFESRYIRARINELDVDEFMKRKKRKGPGFLERMEEERKKRQAYVPTPKRTTGKKRK